MDQDDAEKPVEPAAGKPPKAGRDARLAQALRANLRRRKQGGGKPSPSAD